MATAMVYDTLKLAEQLEHEAGFDAARAKAMARILAENASGNLVTREDLLATQGALGAAIQGTREDLFAAKGELGAAIQGTREDLFAAKGELQEAIHAVRGDVRVLYWISGTTLAGVATLLSIAITIALHLMRLG